MSQHDYNVANAAGAAVRADINSVLGAIATRNSGASAPSTTFAYQVWVDTTNFVIKHRNAANSGWLVDSTADESFVLSRSTNTMLDVSDFGKAIVATAAFTQTLDAAATLGDGWCVDYRNESAGNTVFDPNSTEQIDGATTLSLPAGQSCRIYCNGSAFKTFGLGPWPFIDSNPIVVGSSDATKKVRFEVDGLTSGATRVITVPDMDVTLVPAVAKTKVVDESRTSNTTLADDNTLSFAIGAGQQWTVRFALDCGGVLTSTGVKFAITVPSGASLAAKVVSTASGNQPYSKSSASGGAMNYAPAALGLTEGMFVLDLWVLNGGNAGNVTLQWAQHTSSVGALTVRQGSSMVAHRVS